MDSQLCLNVFTREMEQHDNPHLTFETLVLRLLKRVSHSFHLPWSHVLEVSRQAPYLMDPHLHQDLLHIWTLRSKHATLDEQHCVERILGRDNVRSSDLIKLASILQKISDPKTVYEFFAMDGYQGEDPKKYIDLFRYEAEEARGKHVRAVRQLYRSGSCRPLTNVDPFWKVFLRERAPNRETGTWSRSKSRWRRLRNGAVNSRRKRSDPWRPKRKCQEKCSWKPIVEIP
ncbi:uncharacterized protein TNCT_313351 [Trichonephila clavata]|uniref:Uncharacterized protein n=2 Tax=Trichonephila clavata TaxID=2740835 RepID=A0A8X6K0S1_TRICU|nr:uncharacterized protein TNCT_313351 [Trichonephila clavata]